MALMKCNIFLLSLVTNKDGNVSQNSVDLMLNILPRYIFAVLQECARQGSQKNECDVTDAKSNFTALKSQK